MKRQLSIQCFINKKAKIQEDDQDPPAAKVRRCVSEDPHDCRSDGIKEKPPLCMTTAVNDGPESDGSATSSSPQPQSLPSHPFDIGLATVAIKNSALNADEKYNFLTRTWTPDKCYKFPTVMQGSRGRKFNLSWFEKHTWLAYSAEMEGGFCKVCILFGQSEGLGKGSHVKAGKFVTHPLQRFKDATHDMNTHENLDYHKHNQVVAENFIQFYEGKRQSVEEQLLSGSKREAMANRERLLPIVKTVVFCGTQGLALRGHRDSGPLSVERPDENDGNFRAALRFRLDAGDQVLKKHIDTCPRNATYLSWNIQNEIICSTGKLMRDKLVADANQAGMFTVIADGTIDSSVKDQLALLVRYVGMKGNIHEDFLGFEEATDGTGKAIAELIVSKLKEYGLDLSLLRGQAYDGCAAMKGDTNGAQAHIRQIYKKAIFTHCSSHVFSLVVCQAAKVQAVNNCVGTVKEIINFMRASAKRMREFDSKVLEQKQSSACGQSHKTLLSLCETRWSERHDSIIRFKEFYQVIVNTLEEICDWKDHTASSKASQMLAAMTAHRFVVALCVCERFAKLLLPISVQLQNPKLDILQCAEEVNNLLEILTSIRASAEEDFHIIFMEAENLLGEQIQVPRQCTKQTKRSNPGTHEPETYFRISVFLPYLDNLLQEVRERFSTHTQTALCLQYLIPKYVNKTTFDQVNEAAEFYKEDLPGTLTDLRGEIERWCHKWNTENVTSVNNEKIPATCSEVLALETLGVFYPNIFQLVKILCTLPVTSASAERSFSCLRKLKTYLRSTMHEERLSGLALMNIHRNKVPSEEEIIAELASKARVRKMCIKI